MAPVPFDPAPYVELARRHAPGEAWLPGALAACTTAWWESPAYAYLTDPATWRTVERCVELDGGAVHVVVDVLAGARVGGLELLHELRRLTG